MLEKLRVLVLNSGYEPLHFAPAKRAIVMLLTERAERVETDGVTIRSTSGLFPCPTVIRLNRYVKARRWGGVPFSKKNVIRRDRRTCQYCSATNVELTIDHIVPRSMGGGSHWLNVVAACKKCNSKKGSRPLEKSGLRLKNRPYVPKFVALLTLPRGIPATFAASWRKYLPEEEKVFI